uniref:Uncharacterized protein n=1 Tax=Ditylum brightwellii TaxID=49249 RepID=A0A7S4QVH8_9STRA
MGILGQVGEDDTNNLSRDRGPAFNKARLVSASHSFSDYNTINSFSTMSSLNQDDQIESFLARKFTPPVGASREEINKLNYFHLMQRAIAVANSKNPSEEEIHNIISLAEKNDVLHNDIMGILGQVGEDDTNNISRDRRVFSFYSDDHSHISSHLSEDNADYGDLKKPNPTSVSQESPTDIISASFSMHFGSDESISSFPIYPVFTGNDSFATNQSVSEPGTIKSFGAIESMNQDDMIENFLARKFTAPVGASPEEIKNLTFFQLMMRAIDIADSKNPSKEDMAGIISHAKENGIPTNDIMKIFEKVENGARTCERKDEPPRGILIDMGRALTDQNQKTRHVGTSSLQNSSNNCSDGTSSTLIKSLVDSMEDESSCESGSIEGCFVQGVRSVWNTDKQVNNVEDDETATSGDSSTSTVEEQFDETCGKSISTHDSFCPEKYGNMEEVDDNEEIAAFLTRFSHLQAGGHFPNGNVEGIGEFGASCKNKDPEDAVEVDLEYGFVKKANMASIANIRGLEAKRSFQRFLSKKGWVSNGRRWAIKKHLKLSREERTKAHPGYSGVDIESLHRHCEAVRDQPNILFKENSAKSSGDWIGEPAQTFANDKSQQHITQAGLRSRMPEVFISVPSPQEMIIEIAKDAMNGDLINRDNLCAVVGDEIHDNATVDSPNIVTVDSCNSGSLGISIKDSLSHQDITCFSHEDIIGENPMLQSEVVRSSPSYDSNYSILSDGSFSYFSDDDDACYDLGTFKNGRPKIGERVTKLHYSIKSSYAKCAWRKEHFPVDTFPYKSDTYC